jgi:hypothetical protein
MMPEPDESNMSIQDLPIGPPRRAVRTAALLAIAVFTLLQATARSAESIEEFNTRKNDWSSLLGASFTLEGRLGIVGTQRITFDRCNLEFRLAPGLAALPRDTRVAEVTGSLSKKDGKLQFDVTEIKARPTDLQALQARRGKIDSSRLKEWYDLADWAEKRGRFYEDTDLTGKALEYREVALMVEYRRLRAGDVDGLLEIAKRAASLGLTETVGWRAIHDACRIQLAKLKSADHPDESVVLDRILKNLPGSNEPLKPEDEPLRLSYKTAPDRVYIDADKQLRKKLHRALYVEVLLGKIERDAKPDGSNGEAIAARISQQLPELAPLADEYRKKETEHLTSKVGSLSRADLLRLVGKYEIEKRPDDVVRVQKEWLKAREKSRREEGPQGLVELAKDYSLLLKDDRTAALLFEEAWQLNPRMKEPAEWLTAHGRVLHNDRWILAEAVPQAPEDRFDEAVREGRVLEGMSESQVRAALGTKPTSVVRQASKAKVTELWVYHSQGLTVSLTRRFDQSEARVDRVNSISQ